MSTWAIGDIQGCFETLHRLLQAIDYKADRDRLILLGDLVNRGPDSLEVLRWARENGCPWDASTRDWAAEKLGYTDDFGNLEVEDDEAALVAAFNAGERREAGATSTSRETATNSAKCSFGIVSGTKALNQHMDALRTQLE